MKFKYEVTVEKTDGDEVDEDIVDEALRDELATIEFDAGEESSVFKIADVERVVE